ncbi:hypothetical protein AG1IA_03896 [Rhizoctonia solani AG-1 IA]|uniref:Uncharacterized protein n=1 Tax=Thanatephorus cucumeris (strain AG1-IA) TaxID=983506 RepID=L8WZ68_THACA|nr:hypothetical protein AG1IA_03896 [Rhizoctonia solani AG-1 IA]
MGPGSMIHSLCIYTLRICGVRLHPPLLPGLLYNASRPASSICRRTSSLFEDPFEDGCIYRYPSKAVSLSFNQVRHDGIRLPAYGREGIISGEVYLRSTAHIESITLSARVGQHYTQPRYYSTNIISCGPCMLEDIPFHCRICCHFLWSFQRPGRTKKHPYRLLLSAQYQKDTFELGTRLLLLCIARVGIIVPRMLDFPILDSNLLIKAAGQGRDREEPPVESPFDMRIIKLVTRRIAEGKSELSHVNAHVSRLGRHRSIPFNLWLSSSGHPIETLLALAPHISIRLVRTVSVTARGSTVSEENIVAHQTLRTSDMLNKTESRGQVLSFTGNVEIPREIWRSWTVPRAARVSVRLFMIRIRPAKPEVAYIDHKVMVAFVSGSGIAIEHPDAPDLDAMPSPAALLKKHTVYMPMRV